MKHLFLINPAAGKKGGISAMVQRVERIFDQRNDICEIRVTRKAEDALQTAREAAQTGEPVRIYACGGDGTLNEVVNGAAGYPNAAVTNVPMGTGNDFLKIFGRDYAARFSDLAALADGPQAVFDLMDCNGKLGLDIICAGVDARVAADVHKYKALPLITGAGAYVLSMGVNALFKGIARRTVVEIAGERTEEDLTVICICNGRYYGGGFMPVGEAMPDDGILDMLVVPAVSRLTFARLVGDYAKGRYKDYPDIIRDYHGQAISFSAEEEMVAVVDGEVMRSKSFHVCLSEKKINFFYPGDLNYRPDEHSASRPVNKK